MTYVIYEKNSTRLVGKVYKTHSAAAAALTRMNRAWAENNNKLGNEPESPQFTHGIAEQDYFHDNIEKQVQRTNLMNGCVYYEPINTPAHLSPACERYWSM